MINISTRHFLLTRMYQAKNVSGYVYDCYGSRILRLQMFRQCDIFCFCFLFHICYSLLYSKISPILNKSKLWL